MTFDRPAIRYALGLIVLFYIALRLISIFQVYYSMDEFCDVGITTDTFKSISSFFSDSGFPDQARLPHMASAPVIYFWKENTRVPLRLLFFVFHLLYLWFSYKLAFFVTRKKSYSWLYALLLLSSCYFSAFSIFSGTTCGWLYMLFHILCIYSFWRSFSEQKISGVFPDYILLSALLGSCVASSLFGLFLLPAFFIFHVLHGNKVRVNKIPPASLIWRALLFLGSVLLAQILPVPLWMKSAVVFLLAVLYAATIAWLSRKERSNSAPPVETSLLLFWLAVGLTAASVTLILSPIYLNVGNILSIPEWVDVFREKPFTQHIPALQCLFNYLRMLFIKFGKFSSLALIVPLFYLAWKNRGRWKGEFHLLIVLVFLVHVLMTGTSSYFVAYYPLAVFPFLYLPFIAFLDMGRRHSRRMMILASLLLLTVFADNQARYFKWFPYAHFDGAQYDSKLPITPVNRSAMISFEAMPLFIEYLRSPEVQEKAPLTVFFSLPKHQGPFNVLLVAGLRIALRESGIKNVSMADPGADPDILLCWYAQPGSSRERFERPFLDRSGYERIKDLSIKGVDIYTIWRLKKAG